MSFLLDSNSLSMSQIPLSPIVLQKSYFYVTLLFNVLSLLVRKVPDITLFWAITEHAIFTCLLLSYLLAQASS